MNVASVTRDRSRAAESGPSQESNQTQESESRARGNNLGFLATPCLMLTLSLEGLQANEVGDGPPLILIIRSGASSAMKC